MIRPLSANNGQMLGCSMNSKKYVAALIVASMLWVFGALGAQKVKFEVPFDMKHKGSTFTTEIEIFEPRTYMLTVDFYSKDKKFDKEASEYLQNLAGSFTQHMVGSQLRQLSYGIELPLSVEITPLDERNQGYQFSVTPTREEENVISGRSCLGGYFCVSRRITNFELVPGHYKVTVTVLDDIPELDDVKTGLSFYSRYY